MDGKIRISGGILWLHSCGNGGRTTSCVGRASAFSWYTGLQRTIKKHWVALKGKSLHHYNEDSNPVMAAVDELKLIKQEKMAIGELASFILLQWCLLYCHIVLIIIPYAP
ncbi:hypothetical protein BC941DRAFT_434533 [Chlamydoabsidia padenii]|nr:hypothetical protein BC941DRAFT_434533 [Chlamydoabsidia padenii]